MTRDWLQTETLPNMGMVASIATTIYAAAHKRVACANAMFMIHPVQNPMNGSLAHESLEALLSSARADEARIDAILRERAAIPNEVLSRRQSVDIFFAAQQALEYGLVHEIADFTLPAGNQIFHI